MNLCQTVHKILKTMLFGVIALSFNLSQANPQKVLQCHKLFISEDTLADKLQTLARVAHELKHSENKNSELFIITEKNFREQLSEIIGMYPRAYQMYMTELKYFNPREVQEKQEKKKAKELKIELVPVYEKLLRLEDNEEFSQNVVAIIKSLKKESRIEVLTKIKDEWLKAKFNTRERNFASRYLEILQESVYQGDIAKLEELFDLQMFDVNTKNENGFSILLAADYADQPNVIDWVLKNPKFNIKKKNKNKLTDVEFLRLMNKNERADYIETIRPESRSRKFEVKERNEEKTKLYPDGTPIIAFVKIQPGSVRVGYDQKVTIKITKPYQVLSVKTTQQMWKVIVELAKKYLNGKYDFEYDLKSDPSQFKGEMNPVENVSHDQVTPWSHAASELSKLDHPEVQKALAEIFPGHQKGAVYRLPTFAESVYMARLGGLANGLFAHANSEKNLKDHAWYDKNAGNSTHPVGLKKPVLINGEPIYDVHGNVLEWVANWTDGDARDRTFRGGSWDSPKKQLYLDSYFSYGGYSRNNILGFRLVRTIP